VTLIDIEHYTFRGYAAAIIRTGQHRTIREVPPAGEEYAFDREEWDHRIEISVSPTGRSTTVWVDGKKVPL
jgi:hypothetical protein